MLEKIRGLREAHRIRCPGVRETNAHDGHYCSNFTIYLCITKYMLVPCIMTRFFLDKISVIRC
jgi:hypothetical protein